MPAHPLSDEETMQQVVAATRQFVGVGRLEGLNATYVLTSCSFDEAPPYQGAVYLDFDVPAPGTRAGPDYLRDLAGSMSRQGWQEGLPPNSHPGGWMMTNSGVSAVFYRNPDVPGKGVLQIRGECRNVTDHRLDDTGFIDITGALK